MAILQSVSKTIRKMIEDKWDSGTTGLYLESEAVTGQTKIKFSTDLPSGDWAKEITDPTINVYLYKVTENTALRSNEWRKEVDSATGRVVRKKPKTRINCSYIITAWKGKIVENPTNTQSFTPDVEIQHKILSEVMSILTSYDSIPSECWVEEMKSSEQKAELPTAALLSDDVKSPGEFWSALENKLAPFLHYVVTVAVTPKENRAQKDATPVSEIGLRSQRDVGNEISTTDIGYYTIGGQIVGVPVGLVGEDIEYVFSNGSTDTLKGEIQYQKDENGDPILNQVVSTSHDFDELLDSLYLDVYEQVRTARVGTQYEFLKELDEYNRARIENQIISGLKQEKTEKMNLLTKYSVEIPKTNREKVPCDKNGRYIYQGLQALGSTTFKLYKGENLITTEDFAIPADPNAPIKKRFTMTASVVGQAFGFPIGEMGAINFTQELNNDAPTKSKTIDISATVNGLTSPEGDLNIYLNSEYAKLIARVGAEDETIYEVPDLSSDEYKLTVDEQEFFRNEIKRKMITALEDEMASKRKLFEDYFIRIGSYKEALDNDGKALFTPELFVPANPLIKDTTTVEFVKGKEEIIASYEVKPANGNFSIDVTGYVSL